MLNISNTLIKGCNLNLLKHHHAAETLLFSVELFQKLELIIFNNQKKEIILSPLNNDKSS